MKELRSGSGLAGAETEGRGSGMDFEDWLVYGRDEPSLLDTERVIMDALEEEASDIRGSFSTAVLSRGAFLADFLYALPDRNIFISL